MGILRNRIENSTVVLRARKYKRHESRSIEGRSITQNNATCLRFFIIVVETGTEQPRLSSL